MHPKEIGYFVAPTKAKAENEGQASDFAMSQPAFVPERHEVWFTDGTSGLLRRCASPTTCGPGSAASPAPACAGARLRTAHVTLPRRSHVRSVQAVLGGKRVRASRSGRTLSVPVDLRGSTKRTVRLRIRVRLSNGRTLRASRVYHPCA